MTDAVQLDELHAELTAATVDRGRRTIGGRLAPYGEVGSTSAGRARFRAGSLRWSDVARVTLNREHQREESFGVARELVDGPDELRGSFYVPPGPLGDRMLEEAANGVRAGLSVELDTIEAHHASDGVLEVTSARVRAVALCSVPAFDSARVDYVAAAHTPGGTMQDTQTAPAAAPPPIPGPQPTELSAAAVLDELMDRLRSGQLVPAPPAGGNVPPPAGAPTSLEAGTARDLDLHTFAELLVRRNRGDDVVTELRAALSDITPVNQPQAFRPAYLTELWDGTDYTRKFIDNATTPRPLPRALKIIGQRWVTRPIVDDYTGNKTAVPSNVPVLEDVEVNVARLAGAHDVDRAMVDLGSPEWLASYFEAQTEDYRRKSDARAATAAWNGAPELVDDDATPATQPTLLEGIVSAVVDLAGLGEAVEYVAMAPGLVRELFGITRDTAPAFFGGAFQLGGQGDGQLGGLTFFTSPGVPANGAIVGQRAALRWHEQTPPIRVQAVDVANGGIDLGVFGYYATYVRNSGQLRRFTVGA